MNRGQNDLNMYINTNYRSLHMVPLQKNLQSYTGITVSEVVKAGSLGHGTAVQGNFDVDLVLYSRGKAQFSCRRALENKLWQHT